MPKRRLARAREAKPEAFRGDETAGAGCLREKRSVEPIPEDDDPVVDEIINLHSGRVLLNLKNCIIYLTNVLRLFSIAVRFGKALYNNTHMKLLLK